jgi:hypothetical protein
MAAMFYGSYFNSNALRAINVSLGAIYDEDGVERISVLDGYMHDSFANPSVNWENRELATASGVKFAWANGPQFPSLTTDGFLRITGSTGAVSVVEAANMLALLGGQPTNANLTAWALLNPATLTTNDLPGIDFGSGTGGGTSLVIEASSSIAVATSGVKRTLSVKPNLYQPTNSTLTTLAAGTATPILGAASDKAAAGDHAHATYITAGTATNIARTVAWAPGLTPYALTAASTVTVTRAMLTTNAASITLTGNTVLSLTTNGWTTAEIARWSLDITKGAHTLGFNTAVYDNTTVLDTSATRVALFFRKQVGDTKHKVRQ